MGDASKGPCTRRGSWQPWVSYGCPWRRTATSRPERHGASWGHARGNEGSLSTSLAAWRLPCTLIAAALETNGGRDAWRGRGCVPCFLSSRFCTAGLWFVLHSDARWHGERERGGRLLVVMVTMTELGTLGCVARMAAARLDVHGFRMAMRGCAGSEGCPVMGARMRRRRPWKERGGRSPPGSVDGGAGDGGCGQESGVANGCKGRYPRPLLFT